MKARSKPDAAEVTVRRADELAFLGAAYLSTDQAYAAVSRKGDDWSVSLSPKSPGISSETLASLFRQTYDNQLLRWAVAKANKGVRAAVLKRALILAAEPGGRAAARQGDLLPEQKEEIARLLAEAEADKGPRDPLGIARYWEDLGGKKA